jgi:hypothetical protein
MLLVEFVESTGTPVTAVARAETHDSDPEDTEPTVPIVAGVDTSDSPTVPIVAGVDTRKKPIPTFPPEAEVTLGDLIVDPVDPLLGGDDSIDPVPVAAGANVDGAVELEEEALNRELFDDEGRMIIQKHVEEIVEAKKLCQYWVIGKIATQQTMCRNLFIYISALACNEAKDDTVALVDLYTLLAIKFLAFLKSLPLNTYFIENVYSQSGIVFPGEGKWPACFDDYVEQKLMKHPGADFLKKNKKIKEFSDVNKRNSYFGSQVRICMCVDTCPLCAYVVCTMCLYVCRYCHVSSLPSAKSVTG